MSSGAKDRDLRKILKDGLWVLQLGPRSHIVDFQGDLGFDLAQVPTPHREILLKTHLLLHEVFRCGLFPNLGEIRRDLERTSFQFRDTRRNHVGKDISWVETYRERLRYGSINTPIFVSNLRTKVFDVPANRLLKFLLHCLITDIRAIERRIHFDAPGVVASLTDPRYLSGYLKEFYAQITWLMKSEYLQSIPLVNSIPAYYIVEAKRSRRTPYHAVAEAFELYERYVLRNPNRLVPADLIRHVLLNSSADKKFEVAVLITVLRELNSLFDEPPELGLLHRGARWVARYRNREVELEVRYQKMPGTQSRYTTLLREAGLQHVQSRIPDIVLTSTSLATGRKQSVILEVKNSSNPGTLTQGIYQLFGYLLDFQDSLEFGIPKGILVSWRGIKPVIKRDRDVWLVPFASIGDAIRAYHSLLRDQFS